jgi:hypothetical protein
MQYIEGYVHLFITNTDPPKLIQNMNLTLYLGQGKLRWNHICLLEKSIWSRLDKMISLRINLIRLHVVA